MEIDVNKYKVFGSKDQNMPPTKPTITFSAKTHRITINAESGRLFDLTAGMIIKFLEFNNHWYIVKTNDKDGIKLTWGNQKNKILSLRASKILRQFRTSIPCAANQIFKLKIDLEKTLDGFNLIQIITEKPHKL